MPSSRSPALRQARSRLSSLRAVVAAAGFLPRARRHTSNGTTTEPPPALIPPGVTISGIPVGGLTPDEARLPSLHERFELRRFRSPWAASAGLAPMPSTARRRPARTTRRSPRARNPRQERSDVARPDRRCCRPAYVQPVARRSTASRSMLRSSCGSWNPVVVPDRPGVEGQSRRADDRDRLAPPGDESRPSADQARRAAGDAQRQARSAP